ncbi:transposase [Microbulbifer discodermiae]
MIQAWVSQKRYRRKDDNSDLLAGCGRTSRHVGYQISHRCRKRVEEPFGWGKSVDHMRQMKILGLPKVNNVFMLAMNGWNLTRMRALQG